MRGTKTIPQPKKDVERLDNELLQELIALKENEGFKILKSLMDEFVARRIEDIVETVEARKFEDIGISISQVSQTKIAIEYLLDTPTRAEEEIKRRGLETIK